MVICLERGADCLHVVQLMPLHPKTPSSLASFKSRLVLIIVYSSATQQADTDRQTDRIQLTNTCNTKLKPKVTKCQIIHAVHFCHCFTFLVPAYRGCPGKEAVKRL